jgi:glycosyl transferase family 87
MSTDRRILWGSSAALMLLLGGYLQQEWRALAADRPDERWRSASGSDFAVYYVAGRVARGEGGGRLYQGTPNAAIVDPHSPWLEVARSSGVVAETPFQYPPLFALLVRPLTHLPLEWAFFAWRQASTLAVVLAIYLALANFRATPRAPVFVVAVAAALASFPFVETTELGQVGGLVLLLWTLGVCFADRGRAIPGAFCFALGTIAKLTPAFVVPLFLLRKQWRWLAAYAGWMTLFLVIGIWQLGWENHVTFFSQVLPAMSCGLASSRNKSLVTMVQSLYFGDAFYEPSQTPTVPLGVCWLGKAVSLGLYCVVLIYVCARRKDARHLGYEVSVLALVSLLVSPLTWRHHYLLSLLPLLYLWSAADVRSLSRRDCALLFLATLAIGTPFPHYLLGLVRHPVLQVMVTSAMPAGALALLALSLVYYPPSAGPARAEPSQPEKREIGVTAPA